MERLDAGRDVHRRWGEILVIAGTLGIAGNCLLRPWPLGLGLAIWIALLLAGLAIASHRAGIGVIGGALPGAAALFFGAALAWRDAGGLHAINILMLLVTLGLAGARLRQTGLGRVGIADLTGDLLRVGLGAAFGAPMLFKETQWPAQTWAARKGPILAVLRGLALAIPLCLLFGALLAAADPVFRALVVGWLPAEATWRVVIPHLLVTGLLAWIAAGAFREALAGRPWVLPEAAAAQLPSIGRVELSVVLGLLNVLFLTFVAVQFRYLFGGESLLGVVPGVLTHAEYARRGFFELVFVAALVLAVLLAAHWSLPRGDSATERTYRLLAAVMVALVGVIMASAAYRMWLYVDHFGLTPTRVYATAFMAWLALVIAWFCATVLRGRRERFAAGALAAGLAMVILLNVVNPDALVARVNIGRMADGRPVDVWHLGRLSADAVPALLASIELLPPQDAAILASRLLSRWAYVPTADWRTGNVGRARARSAIREEQEMLERLARTERR
ncbi:MAG TPA: DUF4173 domain-containing protein [Bacillota bacterium]|nr:DUF4173 domain-containing protein [Bacillota bacterium]